MKKLCGFLILLLALIALVGSANANSISFTTSLFEDGGAGNWDFSFTSGNNNQKWYQPTFLGYGDPVNNPPYAINLPQFNPSLGILDKVTLSLSRAVDASVFFQASSSSPTAFRYYLASQAMWVMSGNTLGDFTFAFTDYPNATVVNDTNRHTVLKSRTDNSPSNLFTIDFTPFIGNGTFATELYEACGVGAVFGNGTFGTTFQVTAEVQVNYDYTPVPLPPSLLLLGSGLLGLTLLRGRKLFKD